MAKKVEKLPKPKDAEIGDKFILERKVKGNQRELTYERVHAYGKGRNLHFKLIKNKKK
jgi:hypothetical protein